MAMDELSMVVRRAIAHTAIQYEMSIVQFSHWLVRRNPSMRKDFIGMEEVVHRDLSRTIEGVLTLFIIGEESGVEFDAAKYTELANSGMSNIKIAKEMGYNSDAALRHHAVKAGVHQKNPSGAPMKKADAPKLPPSISLAESKLIMELAQSSAQVSIDKATVAVMAPKPPKAEISTEPWTKLPGGYSDAEYPKEQLITIRIPLHKPSYTYKTRAEREEAVQEAMRLLSDVVESVNDDITDLLGAEDIGRVQAYFDRIVDAAVAQ